MFAVGFAFLFLANRRIARWSLEMGQAVGRESLRGWTRGSVWNALLWRYSAHRLKVCSEFTEAKLESVFKDRNVRLKMAETETAMYEAPCRCQKFSKAFL